MIKTEDIAALQLFNTSSNKIFLTIEKKGNNENLKAVQVNWLGRILMVLGFHPASMPNVIDYLAKYKVEIHDPEMKKLKEKVITYIANRTIVKNTVLNAFPDIYNPAPKTTPPVPPEQPKAAAVITSSATTSADPAAVSPPVSPADTTFMGSVFNVASYVISFLGKITMISLMTASKS